jgi:hypothetical protein
MRSCSSRVAYNQWNLNQLSQVTDLPAQQIERIYQDFMRAGSRNRRLSMHEFARLYNRFLGVQQ